MTPTSTLLLSLARQEIAPGMAIEQLSAAGVPADDAERQVAHTLGADAEIVGAGPSACYRYSGRLVQEVAAELASAPRKPLAQEMQRVDFIACTQEPPQTFLSFFWSTERGLFCTRQEGEMTAGGIATPPEGARVFPNAGRAFFDALLWRGSSYVTVTAPRVVDVGTITGYHFDAGRWVALSI